MTHTVTWRCVWCGAQYASLQGSKFRLYKGRIKRRKCAECVAKESA